MSVLTNNFGYKDLDIEEINWGSVRKRIAEVNPSLAEAIDDIQPEKDQIFYRAKYRYGSKIVDKGQFCLPLKNGGLLALNDVPEKIRKQIGYCPIPLCLIMSKSNEVFVETTQRVVPLNFFLPGDLFGIFEVINEITKIKSEPMWSVTAGARTTFLLPRVSDALAHNRLRKEFNILIKPPANLFEQFEMFKAISDRTSEIPWENEILIFSKTWFYESSKQSTKLYRFLLKLCWKQLQLFRDTIESNLRWATFAEEIGNRNMKPRPYLIDMVKHLTSISHGATVAFMPVIDSIALPVKVIQQAYVDIYALKNYLPTVMQPTKFNINTQPVYCSLSLPTILESSPYVRNAPSIMEDTRDIKRLIEIFIDAVLKHHKLAKHDPINFSRYDFFHTEEDLYLEVQSSERITKEDERFEVYSDIFQNRNVCTNSPFFRGCIRIKQL